MKNGLTVREEASVTSSVMYGVATWLAYAAVEFVLFSVVPVVTRLGLVLNAPLWHATGMLFATYALIGGVLGAISGGLLLRLSKPSRPTTHQLLLAITLPLPVVFVANLLSHWPLRGDEAITVLVGIVLIGAIATGLRPTVLAERFAFVTGPLAVSTLLLLPVWIGSDMLPGRSAVLRLAAILGASLVAALGFRYMSRLRKWTGTPRPPKYALGVTALLVVACACGAGFSAKMPALPKRDQAKTGQRPNVVLIVMDTVRADHTSVYGYDRDTTPFLRELAKEATLYTRAFAVSDFTLPTHASMFTGLYPRTHGAYYAPPNYPNGLPLSQRFTTMAEVLQANGYRTAGIVANAGYLSTSMGFSQGFELFDSRLPERVAAPSRSPYLRRRVHELLDRFVSTADFEPTTRRAQEINREADRFLNQVDGPFFLFLNYMDAHNPYGPPPPFDRQYPCSYPTIERAERARAAMEPVLTGKRDLLREERTCIASGYDGAITYLDSQIRELIGSLRKRGLYENTLLMITSDHGEALGTRNQLGHAGVSVYQNEVGVPLLIKYPGANSEARVSAEASQVDLLPTVLEAASIPEPAGLQGISLRKLEKGGSRFLVSVSYPEPWLSSLSRQYTRVEMAVIRGDQKLIESSLGKRELFDLSRDINEEHNLYKENDPGVLALSRMLQDWMRTVPPAASEKHGTIDSSTVERLKSLGYAQ